MEGLCPTRTMAPKQESSSEEIPWTLSPHPLVSFRCLSLAEASRKSASKGSWEMESMGTRLPGHRGARDLVDGV